MGSYGLQYLHCTQRNGMQWYAMEPLEVCHVPVMLLCLISAGKVACFSKADYGILLLIFLCLITAITCVHQHKLHGLVPSEQAPMPQRAAERERGYASVWS